MGDRHNVDSLNESSQTRRLLEVRFGSEAVVQHHISRTAAFGGKAAIHDADFQNSNLNDRFTQQRPFRTLENHQTDRQLTARSGHGRPRLNVTANANDLADLYQLCTRIDGGVNRVALCEPQ